MNRPHWHWLLAAALPVASLAGLALTCAEREPIIDERRREIGAKTGKR